MIFDLLLSEDLLGVIDCCLIKDISRPTKAINSPINPIMNAFAIVIVSFDFHSCYKKL